MITHYYGRTESVPILSYIKTHPLIPYLAKHFLNTSASLVVQSLEGLCAINPNLGLDASNKGSSLPRLMFRCITYTYL
jgi:hypothetical protein